MIFSREKLYEQWQLFRIHGVLNSPHLVLIYPIYTIQLKSMCLPFMNNTFEDDEKSSLVLSSKDKNKDLIYNTKGLKLVYDSLKGIYNEEGYWGLYRGYVPMTIHSHLTRIINDKLLKICKSQIKKNPNSYLKMIKFKSCSKYVAEMITYPVLTISTQQAIFDTKKYNSSLNSKEKPISSSVISIFSLLQLSLNSDNGVISLWNGFIAYIIYKIAEDFVGHSLYSLLITKVDCENCLNDKVVRVRSKSSNRRQLRTGINNFVNSLFSPLVLISTIRRCQTNSHEGLCKGDISIKEILTSVNWNIYFGQLIVNSIAVAVYFLENEKNAK